MLCSTRRIFMLHVAATGSALAGTLAYAADPVSTEKLSESDPYARTMGFRLDTTKVDAKKYPRHTAEQNCTKCQLYSGKPGEDWCFCSFYGGRLVSPNGWCRNFKIRKAA